MAAVQSAVSHDPSVNVPEPQKPVAPPPQSSGGLPENVMYKNRLQEYTQRSALPLPMYQTFNEGAQHAPKFRSTVLVEGKHFTSLNTFSHRKEAEQDVSRIALLDIQQNLKNERSPVIREDTLMQVTVFCKSILNEYAVKRNLEKPTYQTTQTQGLLPMFVSVLVFDGITYTGDTGRSKKEAEQLGARAAILSILDSEYGTVIYEIIKSKSKHYSALNIVKDSHNIHNGMMHWGINIGNGLSSNMPFAGSAGNVPPITGSAGNMPAVGSACSMPIFENASNMPIAAISEPYLGQTTTILAAHPPLHEFKKPTIEPPADAIIPPIVFVPPTLQQPMHVSPTSSKKRKRKNKKNAEEKVLPVVVSSNQVPSCSVAQ